MKKAITIGALAIMGVYGATTMVQRPQPPRTAIETKDGRQDVVRNPFDDSSTFADNTSVSLPPTLPDMSVSTPDGISTADLHEPLDDRYQTSISGSCSDSKRSCRDMASCEDARYHLQQCGMTRLDRDGDGIPCESICGH